MALSFTDDLEAPRMTRAVQWVIAINVAVYFVQLTVVGDANMIPALGFSSERLGTAWWSIITYMFVHGGFWHLVLNMITLAMFGPRVEHRWSTLEFARFYVWCGLGGLLFHLIFARDALVVGASAAVYGVMVAYATYWPDDEVLLFGVIPLKAKWFVMLLVLVNLVNGISTSGGGSGVASLAHLGGVAAAWVSLRWASTAARIDRVRQHVSATPDFPDETPRAIPRQQPRSRGGEPRGGIDEIVARSNAALRRREGPAPETSRRASTIDLPAPAGDLDAVLDKISREGIDSLTSEERRILEDRSRKLRGGT
jgi:membrane associated rhomboid family serine protease